MADPESRLSEETLDVIMVGIMLPAGLPLHYPFLTLILVIGLGWSFARIKNPLLLVATIVWAAALVHEMYFTLTNHGPRFDRLMILYYSPMLWLASLLALFALIRHLWRLRSR